MLKMDQFKDPSNLESNSQDESNCSIQVPSSTYHSTRTSFYQDSVNNSFYDNEENPHFVSINGHHAIARDETEETMLDGSCDNLGKSTNRNSKLVGNYICLI